MSNPISLIAVAALLASGLPAAAQAAQPPSPQDFLAMAAQSDAYEIQAGHTAATQSQDPRVRAFAQQMIQDHTQSSTALRQAAAASGLPPPPATMSSDQARMLMALQSLRRADFDQAYGRQQVLAHHEALAVQQAYAAAGTDPNLRKAAQSTVPVIQHHLEMAGQLPMPSP